MIAAQPLRLPLILLLLALAACAAGGVDRASSSRIDRVWSVDVDQRQPNDPLAYSSPAFTSSAGRIVIGGDDARIHIYDTDGREQGAIAVDTPSDSAALTLENGLVIVGDAGGWLFAVDAAAGKIVWKHQLSAPFISTPVLLNGGFVVQTMDDHIYSFSNDGEKRWSYAGTASGLSIYTTAPPLVRGGTVYAVFANSDAVALKADSGDLIWRKQLLLNNDAAVLTELRAPVAQPLYLEHVAIGMERADSALLVAFYQGEIMVLAADSGRQMFSVNNSIKSAPLLDNGTLYLAGASGELQAIDLSNGSVLWKKSLAKGELIGPVIYNGMLWLADDHGAVLRIGKDGNNLASITVSGRIERAPVVTPSGVLVRTGLGQLSLLR